MKKNRKLLKKLFILAICVYVAFTLISQQKLLSQYTQDTKEYATKIQEQEEYKEELAKTKDDVNSLEFIEQTAREKLEMYYPNERVYVDRGI